MSTYSAYTDPELVKLLSQNEEQAFDIIYGRYWEELYKLAFFILRDKEVSKDIVQDIFIWVWEKRHNLDIQSLKLYLRAAVKFKVANYIRSGKMKNNFFEELAKFRPSPASADADELAEMRELKGIIQKAIDDLPEKCREIFRLSRDHRLSNQEIAGKLGISVKTVENQMTIALRRIREAVKSNMLAVFALPVVHCL